MIIEIQPLGAKYSKRNVSSDQYTKMAPCRCWSSAALKQKKQTYKRLQETNVI